jgi:hypothetical protein
MQAELRFINAVPLGEDAMSPLSFLSEKLHTDVKNTCILSGISQANPSAISVSLGLTHQLSSPIGEGHLLFAHGKSKGVASIIWHLAVRTKNAPLPAAHDFETWLDTAHDTIESWFLSLSDGQLLENFRGGNNADV